MHYFYYLKLKTIYGNYETAKTLQKKHHNELLGGSIFTTIQRRQQTNKRATNIRDQPTIQTSADQHGTVRTKHGLINRQTRRQAAETTQYSNHRRSVDAGQTPTVNHDSGVGANGEKPRNNSCTTYLTEGQLSKKFGLKTPLKTAREWPRNMSGKF
jgi:hypothetical protein